MLETFRFHVLPNATVLEAPVRLSRSDAAGDVPISYLRVELSPNVTAVPPPVMVSVPALAPGETVPPAPAVTGPLARPVPPKVPVPLTATAEAPVADPLVLLARCVTDVVVVAPVYVLLLMGL